MFGYTLIKTSELEQKKATMRKHIKSLGKQLSEANKANFQNITRIDLLLNRLTEQGESLEYLLKEKLKMKKM